VFDEPCGIRRSTTASAERLHHLLFVWALLMGDRRAGGSHDDSGEEDGGRALSKAIRARHASLLRKGSCRVVTSFERSEREPRSDDPASPL
jgi:hypothetical protein